MYQSIYLLEIPSSGSYVTAHQRRKTYIKWKFNSNVKTGNEEQPDHKEVKEARAEPVTLNPLALLTLFICE